MLTSEVLVVEDDKPLRAVLSATLEREGFNVREGRDRRRGLALLRFSKADLVVLDLVLPGIGGFDVLAKMRSFTDVPVVVLTVRDSKDDKVGRCVKVQTTTSPSPSTGRSCSRESEPLCGGRHRHPSRTLRERFTTATS